MVIKKEVEETWKEQVRIIRLFIKQKLRVELVATVEIS